MTFNLRYGDVLELVERMHALPPSRRVATESRFKNFSRLNFPPGPRVGSGERTAYGAAQVVMLLLSFELLRHRMPPAVIVELVRTEWLQILPAFSSAARYLANPEPEKGKMDDATILLVDVVALHEVGKVIKTGELLSTIEPMRMSDLNADRLFTGSRSALIIDPLTILRDTARQLPWLRRSHDAADFLEEVGGLDAKI